MVGECFREAGTLVLVFVPLYAIFEPYSPKWSILLALLIIGIGVLLIGIEIEKRRRR
jgi:predicted benzoate:H+ symporter BenE